MSYVTPEGLRKLQDDSKISGRMRHAEQTHGEWTGLQDNFAAIGLAYDEADARYIAACVNFVDQYLKEG